ncbi:MAG: hypothetical protein PHX68_03285 [Alphaproteobacteria bacterium]|nr:hypothetical protein [Alphaproteobacteria bacterium]
MKKILLCSVCLCAAGASATEIAHPFYIPERNHVMAAAAAGLSAEDYKNRAGLSVKHRTKTLGGDLRFGVLDNLAVRFALSNAWMNSRYASAPSDKEGKNIDWEAGALYNAPLDSNWLLQAGGGYGQRESWSYLNRGEYKYLNASAKAGYQFDEFVPYLSGYMELPLAHKHQLNDPRYLAKLGVYRNYGDVWTGDGGVKFEYRREQQMRAWSLFAEFGYFLGDSGNFWAGWHGEWTACGRQAHDGEARGVSGGVQIKAVF